jgi:hypothetical protein
MVMKKEKLKDVASLFLKDRPGSLDQVAFLLECDGVKPEAARKIFAAVEDMLLRARPAQKGK